RNYGQVGSQHRSDVFVPGDVFRPGHGTGGTLEDDDRSHCAISSGRIGDGQFDVTGYAVPVDLGCSQVDLGGIRERQVVPLHLLGNITHGDARDFAGNDTDHMVGRLQIAVFNYFGKLAHDLLHQKHFRILVGQRGAGIVENVFNRVEAVQSFLGKDCLKVELAAVDQVEFALAYIGERAFNGAQADRDHGTVRVVRQFGDTQFNLIYQHAQFLGSQLFDKVEGVGFRQFECDSGGNRIQRYPVVTEFEVTEVIKAVRGSGRRHYGIGPFLLIRQGGRKDHIDLSHIGQVRTFGVLVDQCI